MSGLAKLAVTVVANLVLGFALVLPISAAAWTIANTVLAPLGLTDEDPEFAREVSTFALIGVGAGLLVIVGFGATNYALSRVLRLPGVACYLVGAGVFIVPYLVLTFAG